MLEVKRYDDYEVVSGKGGRGVTVMLYCAHGKKK